MTAYASEFAKHTILKERGFAFLLDISGKLFKAPKPSLKDVEGNTEVGDCMSKYVMFWNGYSLLNIYVVCCEDNDIYIYIENICSLYLIYVFKGFRLPPC